MNKIRATVALLTLASTAGWWAGVPVAHAQPAEAPRVVEGQVVNGTAGGGSTAGLPVVLHRHSLTEEDDHDTAVDQAGRFRFDGIAFDPDVVYGVSVSYQGALYGADVDPSEGSPLHVTLTVYEATDSETALEVSNASVMFADVDKGTQTVWALEIVKISNGTDRTYVPGPEPMKLLRFGLPRGAWGLSVDTRLLGADVLQVDKGFALTASVPPGDHEVMYEYFFPYSGSETLFGRSLPYGADSVRVLVPGGEIEVSSEQLAGPEAVTVGARPYQLLSASDMARGSTILLQLRGLPQASFSDRLGRRLEAVRFEYVAPMGLALLMATLIGFALWRRGTARRANALGITSMPTGEGDRILQMIAELEGSFQEGAVSEERYRRRRAALVGRLSKLSGRPPGAPRAGRTSSVRPEPGEGPAPSWADPFR